MLVCAARRERSPRISDEPHSKLYLAILIILLIFFAPLILYLAFRMNKVEASSVAESTPSPSAVVAATYTPEPTASPSPVIPPLPDAKFVVWLDDLTPFTDYKDNFTIGGWGDRTSFLIGDRSYSHGIGMQICGTAQEQLVDDDDTSEGVFTHNCKMTSMSYALRGNYSKLVFSLGVDSNVKGEFGPKERNGEGRIVLTDMSRNGDSVLFDTGWQDYTYEKYEVEVPLKGVDIFKITVMSKNYEKSATKKGLRFAIIDALLFVNSTI